MRFLNVVVGALLCAAAVCVAAPASKQVFFHKIYAGKIAGKYAFTMDLKNLDGTLSGWYHYAGKTNQLYLRGSVDGAGSVKMDETVSNKVSGRFTGSIAGTTFTGVWTSADGSKMLPFTADQTSEILIGEKKDILKNALGDYRLTAISGSGGANAMWETWKQKGKWGSNTSANSGGMRTGTEIALDRNDIRLLDSLAIRVDPDLGVRFLAGTKTIVAIPYRDDGMQLELKHLTERDIDQLKSFTANTTVLDEHLYLLAKTGVDYSSAIHGNFEGDFSGVVIVSYAIAADTFDVTFYPGDCCGETSFTFARQAKR